MAQDRFDHVFVEPASFDASLAFYRDALGWTERFSWGGSGEPRGVCLTSAGGMSTARPSEGARTEAREREGSLMSIVLAEPHPAADHSKSHGINGTRPTLHLRVDDIEARHAELAAKGAALFAPEATHWGTRWFVACDPDGNLIAFEQRP